jgi:hopanoid C-2 methylase
MVECKGPDFIYFVDDNFIANRRAARELLPHLVDWQRRNGYPLAFSCEATLNIAKRPEILELMREAAFQSVFCGIETPDPAALKAMAKDHNMAVPILEAVETLNSYGMEVVAGIILGLDGDTPDTGQRLLEFIDQTNIPMLTINLLEALPRTPLWERLEREGRLNHAGDRESNVEFRQGYDEVVATWRHCMGEAYRPDKLFARFAHQVRHTYPNRFKRPAKGRLSWRNAGRGAAILARVLRDVGLRGDFRAEFWKFALPRLVRGDIEAVISVAIQAHGMGERTVVEPAAGRVRHLLAPLLRQAPQFAHRVVAHRLAEGRRQVGPGDADVVEHMVAEMLQFAQAAALAPV